MRNIIDLSGRQILITGASSGIGAATAITCSQIGAKVILVARREDKLQSVLNLLEGSNHKYYCFDLTQVIEIESFIKEMISECGPVDGFVHSAGISCRRPIRQTKPEIMKNVLDINLCSFIEIVRCITKRDSYNAGLSIVGVSSVSSLMGNKAKVAYSVSKAGIDAAIRCIAKELADVGIRANSVCPGIIQTDFYEQLKKVTGDSEDTIAGIERQYLGLGKPEDVANMIAFLLSDASRLITGASIGIDGGMLSS